MIDHISSLKAIAAVPSASARDSEKPTIATAATGNSGSTQSLSKLISIARSLADEGPPIDGAKVARVRQALADGTYLVDVEALANAMLRYSHKEDK